MAHGQLRLVLDSEVFSTNLQSNVSIVHRSCKDLSPRILDGLEMMSLVSVLGSLPLQVFVEFSLPSPIISLQASHPLQVGGQVVIQILHSLFQALDVLYACQTPRHPCSQDP